MADAETPPTEDVFQHNYGAKNEDFSGKSESEKTQKPLYNLADEGLPPLNQRISFSGIKILTNVPGYVDVVRWGVGGREVSKPNLGSGFKILFSFGGLGGSYMFVDKRKMGLDLPYQDVMTNDPYQIRVNGVAHVQVEDSVKVAYKERDYLSRLENLCGGELAKAVGSRDIFDTLAMQGKTGAINYDNDAFKDMGVKVYDIQLKEVDIPQELEKEIARKGLAELHKQELVLIAEGQQEAAKILRSTVEQQYKVTGDKAIFEMMAYLKYLETIENSSKEGKGATFVMSDFLKFREMFSNIVPNA